MLWAEVPDRLFNTGMDPLTAISATAFLEDGRAILELYPIEIVTGLVVTLANLRGISTEMGFIEKKEFAGIVLSNKLNQDIVCGS